MSVDMYVSSSQRQATSVAKMCQKQIQGYEELQRAIDSFVLTSPMLTGATYDSAKQFFISVLQPLSRGGILLSEAVMEACQKFPEEYLANVDSGDLKESDLREKIARINRLTAELSELQDRLHSLLFRQQQNGTLDGSIASRMSSNHSLMATYEQVKRKLQEKLDDLLEFNATSPMIFSKINALKAAVTAGTDLANGSWNSNLSRFVTPPSDKMKWTATIADSWVIRDNRAKGIDSAKVEELKDYDIYAKVIYDANGNPKVFWQLMKDGKGVKNKELYRYLKKAGEHLDPSMFEFISLEDWDKKVKEGFKQGLNIETGDEYKGAIKGIVATSQVVEDVYTWTTESELAQALQILGFTYASYRIASSTGKPKYTGAESPMIGKDWNNYFKEEYGAQNVQWKPTSFNDIIVSPERLYGSTKKEIQSILGSGWIEDTYGSAGKGWKFINKGDGMVFYHSGEGIHVGAYYGFSSGKTGKVKVIRADDNYVPTPNDGATLVIIE